MTDNKDYYEKLYKNNTKPNKYIKRKVKLILEKIPQDVNDIVDIGCGDGKITNELNKYYTTLGIDRNHLAVENVDGEKMVSSCDKIDIEDNSFDMVFSSELLEHLEDDTFYDTIKEMKRISRKYIFLTVPNGENVQKDYIQCKNCKNIFNKTYHLRSIDLKKIKHNFREYKITNTFVYGSGKRGYNSFLLKIKHKYTPSSSWIPTYWTKQSSRNYMCPKCGKILNYPYKFNVLSSLCDITNIIFSPHKPYWLFTLLEKK